MIISITRNRGGYPIPSICFLLLLLLALNNFQTFGVHSFSMKQRHIFDANMKTKIASSVAKTERREVERSRVGRPVCDKCSRHPELCVCTSLPDQLIDTSTSILILQHPRERRRKSLSTVPLMPLVLKKCTVKTAYRFIPENLDLVTECLERGQKPLLLFPGPNAISLDDDTNAEKGEKIIQSLQDNEQLLILVSDVWCVLVSLHTHHIQMPSNLLWFEQYTDWWYLVRGKRNHISVSRADRRMPANSISVCTWIDIPNRAAERTKKALSIHIGKLRRGAPIPWVLFRMLKRS